MFRILIVEDEPAMRLGLTDNLEFEGYEVDFVEDGEAGIEALTTKSYDLVLLDVMLPKISGFDVCRNIRKAGSKIPIILLTARGEEIDKVLGLELGADDYVTKPFSVRELMARVKALLRRSQSETEVNQKEVVKIGRLQVNFGTLTATCMDEEIKMSHREFEVLKHLYQHKNKLVSRHELLEEVWGYDEQPTTRTVDNFIVRLRQKIEDDPNTPKLIITVHGAGYKLIME